VKVLLQAADDFEYSQFPITTLMSMELFSKVAVAVGGQYGEMCQAALSKNMDVVSWKIWVVVDRAL
jgi:hypothetical protein